MARPARWRSAARRGPTPFRILQRSVSRWITGRSSTVALPTRDLANRGGQLERLVHVDAGRILRRARVVAEELLQERLGDRDAGDLRRLELELAHAVLRRERAGGGDRQPSREIADTDRSSRASSACARRRDRRGRARSRGRRRARCSFGSTMPTGTWRPAWNSRYEFTSTSVTCVDARRGRAGASGVPSDDLRQLGLEAVGVLLRELAWPASGAGSAPATSAIASIADVAAGWRVHAVTVLTVNASLEPANRPNYNLEPA